MSRIFRQQIEPLPAKPIRIVFNEDTLSDAELELRELRRAGVPIEYRVVDSEAMFRQALLEFEPDLILSDFTIPGFGGLKALAIARELRPGTPFIFVSGTIGEEVAIESLRHGAADYILKSNLKRLVPAVQRALQDVADRRAREDAERLLDEARIRFELFMRYLPGAAFIKDRLGRYQFVNQSWEQIHRKKQEDVIGRIDADMWPERILTHDAGELPELGRSDVLRSIETFPLPDGIHQYLTHRFSILDGEGHSTFVGGIAIDVTERIQLEAALQEREAGLRRAQHMAKLAHVITGVDGALVDWSDTLPELVGRTRDEMPKNTAEWLDLVHPDDRAGFVEKCTQARECGTQAEIGYRLLREGGDCIRIRQVIEPLQGQADSAGHRRCFSTLQDVTEQFLAQHKIERLNRVYAVLSGISGLIVRVHQREELFNEACRIAVETGRFKLAWIGMADASLMRISPSAWHGGDSDYIDLMPLALDDAVPHDYGVSGRAVTQRRAVVVNDLLGDPSIVVSREILQNYGFRSLAVLPLFVAHEVVAVMALYADTVDFFVDEEMRLLLDMANDISFGLEHIDKEARLDYLVHYDTLTWLPNRILLQDYLARAVRCAGEEAAQVAMVMIDIKRFGHINDTLGRAAGDVLLRDFGQRLNAAWPEPGNLGRISADCFGGIVADFKDASDIAHLIENSLTNMLGEPFNAGGEQLRISVSCGIAIFPDDGEHADSLFRNAETALKKAKAGGEKYLFYHAEMHAAVTHTLRLENNLRRAIENEEFVLHYQPKLDLATGRISGLEALIRWNDPQAGLVYPGAFIPLLEETGMILDVGLWVIRKALQDHRDWCLQGLQPPRVAVNVSLIQLRQKNFVEMIRNVVGETGASPLGLDIEITESLIMEDIEGNIGKLQALREMGINIAIDDFGTGYSSLGYMARLPVNLLKVDRSFIGKMTQEAVSMSIVSTIISLAHSLGIKVIAEGVETQEQSHFLKLLKCDEIQGYFFCRPVPAAQVTQMLEERHQPHGARVAE